MITLTDGNITIRLTKRDMELIEDGLREIRYVDWRRENTNPEIEAVLCKLEGLKY
jgi:hypothetical protein